MKRITVIGLMALSFILMIALCACGAEQEEASVGQNPTASSETAAEEAGDAADAQDGDEQAGAQDDGNADNQTGPQTDAGQSGSPAGSSDASGQAGLQTADGFIIPEYEGKPSITLNGNTPVFKDDLKTEDSFENYGKLDKRGRCTAAVANLSIDTQPAATEQRGDIASVHPSGWRSGQGWERCHLIGWQLSAENDNKRNLVTGTHYMNVDGMLPYENEVAVYIEDTGNHVLYEVEPVFRGKNMVCSGVHMQAESVEDDGKGVSFNVFCFNVSPGHEINYKTGEVTVTDEAVASENAFERVYVINKNTMKFHYPSCESVAKMEEHNKETVTTSRQELISQGYSPCGNCEP